MAKTLTIVAERPRRKPNEGEGDVVIEAVWKKVDGRKNKNDHDAMRASTVGEVMLALNAKVKKQGADATTLIQIIGHGAPGMLWLGGSWVNSRGAAQGVKLLINSNPDWYGDLLDGVHPDCEVRLVGCAIGDEIKLEENKDSARIADGPTLLFDLSRMWGCEVTAPKDLVTADDLDDEGIFDHPQRLRRASELGVKEITGLPHMRIFQPIPTPRSVIGIVDIIGLPLVGMLKVPRPKDRRGNVLPMPQLTVQLNRLAAFIGEEVDASDLLAGPEIEVSLLVDGQPAIGEIIFKLRLLRVRMPTGDRYFRFDVTRRGSVLKSVKSIVDAFKAVRASRPSLLDG